MLRLRRSAQPENAGSPPALEGEDARDVEALHDERLALAAQRGDLPSFNALVARHERALYAICFRMLGDVAAAEDAVQDAFIKAWTSIDSFRGGLVRPWLTRIAVNRCLDILRARGRRPTQSLDAQPVEIEPVWTSSAGAREQPEEHAARTELSGFLERALGRLPDEQRVVILLSDVQGYSYEEIAASTGVAVGTVKSRLSRARARLRELLVSDPQASELFERFRRHYDD